MTIDIAKLRAETLALMETAKRDDCLDRMVPSDLRIAYGTTLRLLDEIERLRAENERMRTALERIACQKRTDELVTAFDVEYADFEDGYDLAVGAARAALAEGGPDA